MGMKVPKHDIQRSQRFKDMMNTLVGERSFLLDAKTIKLAILKVVPNTHTMDSSTATKV